MTDRESRYGNRIKWALALLLVAIALGFVAAAVKGSIGVALLLFAFLFYDLSRELHCHAQEHKAVINGYTNDYEFEGWRP